MSSDGKTIKRSARQALIIGAGPAGLTAAYEFLDKTDIHPVVLEMTGDIGGISKTVNYKGNRMDIGGHRFFSKSDRVMAWWQNILPVQGALSRDQPAGNNDLPLSQAKDAPDPEKTDLVMLLRSRLSRILFLRRFFDYPVSLTWSTVRNLGVVRIIKIGVSYGKAKLFPIKQEKSLEDFFINRFGEELYRTFFKDYTEKVWGVACSVIKADWGAQRIKGLSVGKTLLHAAGRLFRKDRSVGQKQTETSLIERFLYPKLGPGQLWEEVARRITQKGGEIHFQSRVTGLQVREGKIVELTAENAMTGEKSVFHPDVVLSSMPVRELIRAMGPVVPDPVQQVAEGLRYRDFITVGVLVRKLIMKSRTKGATANDIIPDNWIYIQEPEVKLGRIQIFNNWSPYMVKDPGTVWLGLEYFCNEGDELWDQPDQEFAEFAAAELVKIGMIDREDVLAHTVVRMPKAYPAYFGSYDRFPEIRAYLDDIENLFLVGRNGMHRYNNSDHSMLTAMAAVENIARGDRSKDAIWAVNAEGEYHERK